MAAYFADKRRLAASKAPHRCAGRGLHRKGRESQPASGHFQWLSAWLSTQRRPVAQVSVDCHRAWVQAMDALHAI